MTTFSKIPGKPYTARDIASIIEDAREYILRTRPEDVNSFFAGDVPTVLLELVAYVFDNLSYSVDRTGEEAFLATARLRSSALRHAKSVSYPVRTLRSATVDLVPSNLATLTDGLSSVTSATETQSVTISPVPTGGTFTLTFAGHTTAALAYNASGPQIQSALQALPSIGAGNITATSPTPGTYVLTFDGDMRFVEGLSLISTTTTALTRNHVVQITVAASGGTFTITYNGYTTSALAYNASAATVQTALEALTPVIGVGDVVVTRVGGLYTLRFQGALSNQALTPVTLDTTSLTGTATVAVTTQGGIPTASTTRVVAGLDKTKTATFTAGTSIKVGTLTWEVAKTTTIRGRDVNADNYRTAFVVPVSEGRSFGELFTSDGSASLRLTTQTPAVIEGTISVRVGGPESPEWTRVDAINTANATSTVYTLSYDSQGRAVITFGNGTNGAVPASNAGIYVYGRTGNGASGNLPAGAVVGGLACTITDKNGLTSTGSVDLVNIAASAGGRDAESLEEIRGNVPAWIRTVDKAITKEDVETLAIQSPIEDGSVSRAAAYLASATIASLTSGQTPSPQTPVTVAKGSRVTVGPLELSTSKDIVFDEPDPVLFINPNLVYLYLWSPSTRGHVPATTNVQQQVLTYLLPRLLLTVTLRPMPGRNRTINIDLGVVSYYTSVSEQQVRANIDAAVLSMFTSVYAQPGKAFRLSDLYRAVEECDGVDHFEIVSPVSDVDLAKDEMPLLGTLTYTLRPVPPPLDPDVSRAALTNRLFN